MTTTANCLLVFITRTIIIHFLDYECRFFAQCRLHFYGFTKAMKSTLVPKSTALKAKHNLKQKNNYF